MALMIVPPATAYLLTRQLNQMIYLSITIGVLGAWIGYGVTQVFDGSIAGTMAASVGFLFVLALVFSPEHGLLIKGYTHKQQERFFSATLLLIQLYHHENTQAEAFENSFENLIQHIDWNPRFSQKIISYAINKGYLENQKDCFYLTDLGQEMAKQSIVA